MGIASKWLCCIFGPSYSKPPRNDKRRWHFIKLFRQKDSSATVVAANIECNNNDAKSSMYVNPDEHAKPVAFATTAAAVNPTGAAAAVVRLANRSSCSASESADIASSLRLNMEAATITIQSVYRGHLARRALRALKALVKIQAMVRGHIERKRAAEMLRRLQILVRAQLRARTGQIRVTPSSHPSSKTSHVHHADPSTPANYERAFLSKSRKYEPSMVKINVSKSSRRTLDNHEKLYLGRNFSDLRMAEKIRARKVRSTRVAPTYEEKNDNTPFRQRRNRVFQKEAASLLPKLIDQEDT